MCLWQECEVSLQNQFSRTQKLFLWTCEQSSHKVLSVIAEHYFGYFIFFNLHETKNIVWEDLAEYFSYAGEQNLTHSSFSRSLLKLTSYLPGRYHQQIFKSWSSSILCWSFRPCEWIDSLLQCIYKQSCSLLSCEFINNRVAFIYFVLVWFCVWDMTFMTLESHECSS